MTTTTTTRMMTTTTMTTVMMLPSRRSLHEHSNFPVRNIPKHVLSCQNATNIRFLSAAKMLQEPCASSKRVPNRSLVRALSAAGSGLEATITDPKENALSVKNAKVVLESQDNDNIQVRVDLTGEETKIVFDKVLTNLARTAPPVPGFRRQKGGKTSKVPKDFLLQMLGEERVTNFVIQEIVSSTLADYVKKENLNVKDNKVSTIQTAEELKSLFSPGFAFGFSATLELEKETTETSS